MRLREVLEDDHALVVTVLIFANRYMMCALEHQCDFIIAERASTMKPHDIKNLMKVMTGLSIPCLMATTYRMHVQNHDFNSTPEMIQDFKNCGLCV